MPVPNQVPSVLPARENCQGPCYRGTRLRRETMEMEFTKKTVLQERNQTSADAMRIGRQIGRNSVPDDLLWVAVYCESSGVGEYMTGQK